MNADGIDLQFPKFYIYLFYLFIYVILTWIHYL